MAKESNQQSQLALLPPKEVAQQTDAPDNKPDGRDKVVHETHDDFGVASRVIHEYHPILRYLTDSKTLTIHDGTRFGDHPHRTGHLVKCVIDDIAQEFNPDALNVTRDGKPIDMEDVASFTSKVRKFATVKQTLNMLALYPELWCESGDFDTEIYKLNVANGLLNLETGELETHHPSQMVTKLSSVPWIADAECAAWEEFIDQTTSGDAELATYLQRSVGYWLSGSTQEEIMPIFYGTGANGKSVLLNQIRKILGSGEYARTLGAESLLSSKNKGIRADLQQLQGARLALAIEVNPGRTFDLAVLKTILGGDEISGEAKYQNPVQFVSTAKIVMAVNHLPGLTNIDHAVRRRIHVVPFKHRFNGEVGKEAIERTFDAEMPGILRWAVQGFQMWKAEGLNPPESVKKATADYFASNDHIAEYLQDRTEKVADAETPIGLAFDDYKNWAESVGVEVLGKHRFGQLLEAKGFEKARKNSCRYWKDLALKVII